jgi:uncharacterized protein YmfQ (DUF2313 family)
MLSEKLTNMRRALSSALAEGREPGRDELSMLAANLEAAAHEARQLEAQPVPEQARFVLDPACGSAHQKVVDLTQHRRPKPRPVHSDNNGGAA